MKGQSQIVTHAIFVMFSITLILAVTTSMGTIQKNYQNFTGDISQRSLCSLLKTSAEKIYFPSSGNITSNKTVEMGYVILNLPLKIANAQYEIIFSNNTVNITQDKLSYNCNLGINATLSGISHGGRTKIKWLYGNNTNSIVIGNP